MADETAGERTSLRRFYWLALKGMGPAMRNAFDRGGLVLAVAIAVAVFFGPEIAKCAEEWPVVNRWWCLAVLAVYAFLLWMKSLHALFNEMERVRNRALRIESDRDLFIRDCESIVRDLGAVSVSNVHTTAGRSAIWKAVERHQLQAMRGFRNAHQIGLLRKDLPVDWSGSDERDALLAWSRLAKYAEREWPIAVPALRDLGTLEHRPDGSVGLSPESPDAYPYLVRHARALIEAVMRRGLTRPVSTRDASSSGGCPVRSGKLSHAA